MKTDLCLFGTQLDFFPSRVSTEVSGVIFLIGQLLKAQQITWIDLVFRPTSS